MKRAKEEANGKPKGIMKEIPISQVFPNSFNPNVMDEKEFNLLVQNVQDFGMAVPITVVEKGDGTYMIIGGEHRWVERQAVKRAEPSLRHALGRGVLLELRDGASNPPGALQVAASAGAQNIDERRAAAESA